jgi:hypothetical protein
MKKLLHFTKVPPPPELDADALEVDVLPPELDEDEEADAEADADAEGPLATATAPAEDHVQLHPAIASPPLNVKASSRMGNAKLFRVLIIAIFSSIASRFNHSSLTRIYQPYLCRYCIAGSDTRCARRRSLGHRASRTGAPQ